MVSITFSIPEEIRSIMKENPEINWTHIVRNSIEEKAKKLKLRKQMLKELKKEEDFNDWAVELIRKGRDEASR
ncbi:MAG: hypothetical protein Q8P81_00795 [Nanoarchaeota archaeon]|nr:hypothetical protein [Nanoarchaeota archaeon]